MQFYTIQINQRGLDLIRKSLAKRPYAKVAMLIQELETQIAFQDKGGQNAGLASASGDLPDRRDRGVSGGESKDLNTPDNSTRTGKVEKECGTNVETIQRGSSNPRHRASGVVEATGDSPRA